MELNIEDIACRRCHTPCGWPDLKAQEGDKYIFRCPSCGKPVECIDGRVKGYTGH